MEIQINDIIKKAQAMSTSCERQLGNKCRMVLN